jgi:hypothetical protein
LIRIAADLQVIEVEQRGNVLHLSLGGVGFGATEVLQHLRRGKRGEQAKNDQHHQKFDQGKPGGVPPASMSHSSQQTHGTP